MIEYNEPVNPLMDERKRKLEVAKLLKKCHNKSITKVQLDTCKQLLEHRSKKRLLRRSVKEKVQVARKKRNVLKKYRKYVYKSANKQINTFAEITDVYVSKKQLKLSCSLLCKAIRYERLLEDKLLEEFTPGQ